MAFITRQQWDARPPRRAYRLDPASVDEWFLHYTTGEELGVNDCAAWVRRIQAFHMDTKGWDDIAYHRLVCRHGDIFEGRSIYTVGGATYGHNYRSISGCFLGDDDADYLDVTEPARLSLRRCAEEAARAYGYLTPRPHSDVRSTGCPGDELRAWLAAGMPVADPTRLEEEDDTMRYARQKGDATVWVFDGGVRWALSSPAEADRWEPDWRNKVRVLEPTDTAWDVYQVRV